MLPRLIVRNETKPEGGEWLLHQQQRYDSQAVSSTNCADRLAYLDWIVELLDQLLSLAHGRRAIEPDKWIVSFTADLGEEVEGLQETEKCSLLMVTRTSPNLVKFRLFSIGKHTRIVPQKDRQYSGRMLLRATLCSTALLAHLRVVGDEHDPVVGVSPEVREEAREHAHLPGQLHPAAVAARPLPAPGTS